MAISAQQQELVDLLRNELAEVIHCDHAPLGSADIGERLAFLEEMEIQAENFGNAAELVGLTGVAGFCAHLMSYFQTLAAQPEPLPPSVCQLVQSWGVLLLGYLQYLGQDPHERTAVDAILDYLADTRWLEPLTAAARHDLAQKFHQSAVVLDDEQTRYPDAITDDMVSLAVGDDINPELLKGLLIELPSQADAFDRAVEQYLITEDDVQLRIVQRIAHTLKGSANVVGIRGIAYLMHYIEDLLELSSKRQHLDASLGFLLQDAADCLSSASEYLAGLGAAPDNLGEVMASVLDTLRLVQQQSSVPADAPGLAPTLAMAASVQAINAESTSEPAIVGDAAIATECAAEPLRAETVEPPVRPELDMSTATNASALNNILPFTQLKAAELAAGSAQPAHASATQQVTVSEEAIPVLEDIYHRPSGRDSGEIQTRKPDVAEKIGEVTSAANIAVRQTLAPPTEEVDTSLTISETQAQELLRLCGEIQIGNTQLLARLDTVSNGLGAAEDYHRQLRHLAQELERFLEVQTALSAAASPIHEEEMDPLELERHNELNSFASRLLEVSTDAHEAFADMENDVKLLKNLVQNQRQLGFSSQELLLDIRMLPVSVFGSRFNRCVRQVSRLTGKPAQFRLQGEQVLVDSRVLGALVDPIMHLLRNAVDHGLEDTEQERTALGKPAVGSIELVFSRAGDTVVVQCRDDGKGLDYPAIRKTGIERGLVPADADLSTGDLNALVLSPGFSTRQAVTQTSGRGVGLDAVNEQVRLLKGTLSIDSRACQGTTITLVAPMSILSAHTLLVKQGVYYISIISRALEQIVYLDPERLTSRKTQSFYQLADEDSPLPVIPLDDLLHLGNQPAAERYGAVIVLRNREGRRCGVLVEAIRASEEQIIKPLTRHTCRVPGVVGAAILGDGHVSPVIDLYEVPGLTLASERDAWRPRFQQRLDHLQRSAAKPRPMALVVDDSLSARRSLAQFVGDLGMEVFTAKDGFEAIQIIEQRVPSVILVDLEMPRMNGLELTSHLRANPTTQHVPIIMITSRATEKHKTMATRIGVNSYLNKPWTDEELLNSIQSQIA